MFKFFLQRIYIVIILVTIVYWIFFISPLFQSINNLRPVLLEKQNKLQFKKEEIAKLNSLIKKIEAARDKIPQIFRYLPKGPNEKELLTEMESLFLRSGTLLTNINLGKGGKVKIGNWEVNSVLLRLNFIGTYESFKELLKLIEREERIMDVQSIGFSSENLSEIKRGGTLFRGYGFDMSILTYYLE